MSEIEGSDGTLSAEAEGDQRVVFCFRGRKVSTDAVGWQRFARTHAHTHTHTHTHAQAETQTDRQSQTEAPALEYVWRDIC